MRVFGASGYLLSDARVDVRLAYTGFLVLAAIGMATMAMLQWVHIGPTPGNIATYFRGGERWAPRAGKEGDRRCLLTAIQFVRFEIG